MNSYERYNNTISNPYRETKGFGAEVECVKDGVPRCVRRPFDDALEPGPIKKPHPLAAARMRDQIEAVREYKRRVGGHTPSWAASKAPLTTTQQSTREAGQQVIQYLVERIEGKFAISPREVVPTTPLIERASCTQPRKEF